VSSWGRVTAGSAAQGARCRCRVGVVEPKKKKRDALVHNIGSLSALVEPASHPGLFLPYDRLLAPGR